MKKDLNFKNALCAFGRNDLTEAMSSTDKAILADPENEVYKQAAKYLRRIVTAGKGSVYVDDRAFNAFINGGSNLLLYKKTSEALREIYSKYSKPVSLFDVGVGDGKALLPAITENISHVLLLEPSRVMLDKLYNKMLDGYSGLSFTCVNTTFQDFKINFSGHWDIVQGTYSFHSFNYEERIAVFKWIRKHCGRLMIVEFDAPRFEDIYSEEHVNYVVEHYRKGLAEYSLDKDLVAQGFLMPVMFGYFDKSSNRTTFEQPISKWINDLETAGFKKIRTQLLYNFWWADAYLADAE